MKSLDILKAVELATGCEVSFLKGTKRTNYRFMAMFLFIKYGFTLQRTAKELNRISHAGVIYGLGRHDELMFTDVNYKSVFNSIIVLKNKHEIKFCNTDIFKYKSISVSF